MWIFAGQTPCCCWGLEYLQRSLDIECVERGVSYLCIQVLVGQTPYYCWGLEYLQPSLDMDCVERNISPFSVQVLVGNTATNLGKMHSIFHRVIKVIIKGFVVLATFL